MKPYVPLHLHTEYSLLDGATRISELIAHAKANNMPACAITDHGVMYGAVEFYKKAKEEGIKPLIGCELYITDSDINEKKDRKIPNHHIVLIAKDKEGYKNLVKLVSIAHVEGFYYKPRINHEILVKHSKGLICLSACLSGEVSSCILKDNSKQALEKAKYYKELFGQDYYIELQDHGMDEQKRINPELIKIAKELEIELVVTNDSHYTKKEDSITHDILLCLQTGKSKNDPSRMRFPNSEFYIKNYEQLKEAFSGIDEEIFEKAVENTVKIADKCNLIIEMGKSIIPDYPVPPSHTVGSFLNRVAKAGLEERFPDASPEIIERFRYELKTIEDMGFSAYFLIVWDFIKHARESGIPVGPGRGSAAGSLVAYSLGITNIDPIEHDLLFERFLNPERISMPDVDIDFCIDKRDKVIEYVGEKYGNDKVCQIITFGTLAARAALKGVGRVLEMPYAEADRLAKMIPETVKVKIDDALADGMELKKAYDKEPHVRELVDYARAIEGIKFNIGTHAAGIIISRDPLSDIVPVQKSKEGSIITGYAMGDLEMLGLLKMDFLGLRNLTIIDKSLKLIKERKNKDINIDKIPLDDKKVYKMLSGGETDGVFQLESSGMKALVKDLKPTTFEDLGALVALFRPGPLNSGMVGDFVQRKHGKAKVEYKHPSLKPILEDTYGTIVYQEQIMQIAQVLAGYTLGQADILRRAMGKKKHEEMEKQKAIFLSGATKNGVSAELAGELFNTMAEFAAYCFNRSHSAAYAMLAYQTAYLKVHFPVEYMSALLSSVSGNQDKIQLYIAECQRIGIEVLAPDINKSGSDFTPDSDNIRFGLASVKNLGTAIVEAVMKAREEKPFSSFYDYCTRVDMKCLNKRTLESLAKAGAFSGIEKSRKQVFENIESAVGSASRENISKASGQISLFAMGDNQSSYPTFVMSGTEEDFSDSEIQSFEKELLGFYVTSHPLSSIRDKLPFLTTHSISELADLPEGSFVTICGLISSVKLITTKQNKLLKAGTIEDLTGSVEFVAYSEILNQFNSLLETESKVIIGGKTKHRGDEKISINVVIDSVKAVDNTNIVTITLKNKNNFEKIMAIKDFLFEHKGTDPVIFNVHSNGHPVKILISQSYWVRADNELKNAVNKKFGPDVKLSISSLD